MCVEDDDEEIEAFFSLLSEPFSLFVCAFFVLLLRVFFCGGGGVHTHDCRGCRRSGDAVRKVGVGCKEIHENAPSSLVTHTCSEEGGEGRSGQ